MKFDLIISNPPYNRNLDIKILKEIYELAEEIIIIHPSTWILDRNMKSKLYKDIRILLESHVKSVEFFNGNPIFNIELFVPTMITHLKQNHKDECDVKLFEEEFKVKSIFDVTKFGAEWFTIVKPFMGKFVGCDSVWNHKVEVLKEVEGKFHCQLALFRGHQYYDVNNMWRDDFYTMVMKDYDSNKGIRKVFNNKAGTTNMTTFEFDTEQEQDNFINYLKTDFARFCLSIYKNNALLGGKMSLIHWLDFTQEWNDEKLFNHFQIDKVTQDYIRSFLPDYYGIRK